MKDSFHLGLALARLLGTKIIYIPSGCRDEELKAAFQLLDDGSVCGNCGVSTDCSDAENMSFIDRANRYADLSLSLGFFRSTVLNHQPIAYKAMLLGYNSAPTETVRVIHSHSLSGRERLGLNIKGTPIIDEIMTRIVADMPNVEYASVTGLSNSDLQSLQRQSHIVIDQLHYGHWGSTTVEAMANGCVVICYLREEWKAEFHRNFNEFGECPVVSATPHSLELIVRELVHNREKLEQLQVASQKFASVFFNPKRVVDGLIDNFVQL